jgi:AraC-like DNA-binding protein
MRSISTVSLPADRFQPGAAVPWHRHHAPYIAVIVKGRIDEVGEYGRRTMLVGDFTVHEAFEAHADDVGECGAEIINLPLPPDADICGVSGAADIDAILDIVATEGVGAAAQWVLGRGANGRGAKNDWPDDLARDLARDFHLSIVRWAEERGLAPETVSRGFRRAYRISPKSFRAALRARKAAAALRRTSMPLAQLAFEFGYSDQPHLCRAVAELTGVSPAAWRRSNRFNPEAAAPS